MLKSLMRAICVLMFLSLSTGWVHSQNNSSQATEAAKKHRAEKPAASTSAAGKRAAKPQSSVAQQLASCKAAAELNVFKREQCVWNLCKGRWGKDGCPKESTPNTSSR